MGVPGHRQYREMDLFIEAGLPPMEAVQPATVVPARVTNRDKELLYDNNTCLMRNLCCFVLLLFWAVSGSAQLQARSAPALEHTIIGKEKEAIEAVEKNDLKHFASLIADDFLFIADDRFWGKREYLKSFEEDVAWEDCKMEDVRVSSSGENSAIISYKQTWTGRDHGKRFDIVIYTHGHWEKRKGQWVVTLWQDPPAENGSTPADETKPLLTLPPSPGRSNLQTEVLSREHSFMDALKRNDCPTVSGFMADGLVAIGINGIQGKAGYAKLCETRQKQWTDFEVKQVQAYPLRANSAVLVKKVVFSGTDQGKRFRSVEYGHEDWERRNGDWKITGLQDTRAK